MRNLTNRLIKGLAEDLPPMVDVKDMFQDMVQKALHLGLREALDHLSTAGRALRIATCCSGTESPLLATEMICNALQHLSATPLHFEHIFSAEIVPYKQAYIERNFAPRIIFRDIRELKDAVNDKPPMATTAYGARVLVPGNVDLLIAGTACVDFSSLNNHQQDLERSGTGQSSETFYAVLDYVDKARPRIVLIENVRSATWPKMLAEYEEIGYASAGVFVDSKDYYIPQTRERGYMVCIDASGALAATATDAATRWQDLMSELKRRASSSVTAFLLPPELIQQRPPSQGSAKEPEWTKCALRHMLYREKQNLGHARPFTKWQESGTVSVPENGSRAWYERQTERVKDLIDCSILRKAPKYDARFKTRVWDLSQNIHLTEDKGAFGFCTCITPSGIIFVTDAGRVLAAEETLKLQGLPLDRISFTTETSSELQNLAGNAMTTTVVGAAIIAAFISGHRAIPARDKDTAITSSLRELSVAAASQLQSMDSLTSAENDQQLAVLSTSMSELVHMASAAQRQCLCQIGLQHATAPILRCRDCNHTACVRCAGDPAHNYERLLQASPIAGSATAFVRTLRASLPLHLSFHSSSSLDASSTSQTVDFDSLIKAALAKSFSMGQTRRTRRWTTYFHATGARLELSFQGGRVAWYLFVLPPADLLTGSTLRKSFEHPVPRCLDPESVVPPETWEIRAYHQRRVAVRLTGSGKKPSWWSRCQMPQYTKHTIWESLDVVIEDDAVGDAVDLMHLQGHYRHLPDCGTANDSLYVKTSPDQQPIYLFRDPTRTGEPALDCFVFAHNKEPIEYDEVRPIIARLDPRWSPWTFEFDQASQLEQKTSITIDPWQSSTLHLVPAVVDVDIRLSKDFGNTLPCEFSQAIAHCSLLQRSSSTELSSQTAWITELMRRHLPDSTWTPFQGFSIAQRCYICAPLKPQIIWASTDGASLYPIEDSDAATTFEHSTKARPVALSIKTDAHGTSLQLNLLTLVHRVCAELHPAPITKMEWRLGDHNQDAFTFKRLRLQTTVDGELAAADVGMTCSLFPVQRLVLAWMLKQEEGVDISLETLRDQALPSYNWTLEVRGQASLTVRGGICADHPGFGKTITSLALIKTSSVAGGHRATPQTAGLIATDATLIICPQALVRQWADEIQDKLRYEKKRELIVVSKVSHLDDFAVDDYRRAKIVVISRNILINEAYIRRLAAFAAIPPPSTCSGRAFAEWLRYAHRQLGQNVQLLQQRSVDDLQDHIQTRFRINSDEAELSARTSRGCLDNIKAGKAKPLRDKDFSNLDVPLLEMFYFSRLIIDEFHDLTTPLHASITLLQADKRWGLSATPKLNDMYQISQMAALIGVPLQYGSLSTNTMKPQTIRSLQADMTNFERFDSLREVPSNTAHAQMYAMDKLFLETFVRQNIMDFNEIKVERHLVPMALQLNHYVLYHELSTRLYSQRMLFRKTKAPNTDADRRFIAATDGANTAEELLSRYATLSDGSVPDMSLLLEVAVQDVLSAQQELVEAIVDAHRLISEIVDTIDVASMLDEDLYSDELQHYILELFCRVMPPDSSKRSHEQTRQKEMASMLLNCSKTLSAATSAATYLQSTLSGLVCYQAMGTMGSLLDHSSRLGISATCGHVICQSCHERQQSEHNDFCMASGCSAVVLDEGLLWSNVISESIQANHTGKFAALCTILSAVAKNDEKAVVFVQYSSQLQDVQDALKRAKVRHVVVEDASDAGRQVFTFQHDGSVAIVLNASEETAAGLNLQVANHVIFMAPLLRTTQYSYDATMAQAIGRVKRHGQQRVVHVYRIYALHTIDVDILEHREPDLGVVSSQSVHGSQRFSRAFVEDDE